MERLVGDGEWRRDETDRPSSLSFFLSLPLVLRLRGGEGDDSRSLTIRILGNTLKVREVRNGVDVRTEGTVRVKEDRLRVETVRSRGDIL